MGDFKASYEGIGQMLRSAEMQAAMHRIVDEKMLPFAESISPFDPDDPDGQYYKDGFEVSSGVQHEKTSRAYGRLINTDSAAVYVEYGAKATPAYRVLGRSLDAARD